MWKLFSTLFNEVVHLVSLYLLQVTFPTKPCPQQAPCHGSRALSAMPTIRASDTQPLGNLRESLGTSMIPCKLLPTAEDFEITGLSAPMWPIICNIRHWVQFGNNSAFFIRISRLFSDAKKILLYSQNDKSLDGFKELIRAVKVMQNNTAGEYSTVASNKNISHFLKEIAHLKMSILSSSSYHSKLQMPEVFFSIKLIHTVTKLLKGQKRHHSTINVIYMTCALYSKSSKAIFTSLQFLQHFSLNIVLNCKPLKLCGCLKKNFW